MYEHCRMNTHKIDSANWSLSVVYDEITKYGEPEVYEAMAGLAQHTGSS